MSHFYSNLCSILFAFASVFLILIVLLQRGRGGGLAGAFGATGGQSAFGTRAGDVFTKITIGVAIVWVALAAATTFAMRNESTNLFTPVAIDQDAVAPANVPANAGGAADQFEDGNQPQKGAAAAKGEQGKGAAAKGDTTKGAAIVAPTTGGATAPASRSAPSGTNPSADEAKGPAATGPANGANKEAAPSK